MNRFTKFPLLAVAVSTLSVGSALGQELKSPPVSEPALNPELKSEAEVLPADPNQAESPSNDSQQVTKVIPEKIPKAIPKAIPIEEKPFIPLGGIAHLTEQADIDLFTRNKQVGHVQDNPKLAYRRLVQRTIMPTEPLSRAGAVLTFDDHLVADSSKAGSAIDIAKAFTPLNTRAIFFANVNELSEKDLTVILRKKVSSEAKKKLVRELLESKKAVFVKTVRSLLSVQGPADSEGNRQYICEVFNHTAFHQDMSRLKAGTLKFELCLMGIDFVEECIEESYQAERPGWQRARYFRFPFLHAPKDKATQEALNEKFTEHGFICVGETQDSKDVDNYSSNRAYNSLAAAKKGRRYNPKYGVYGRASKPIALFHTKTWKKIQYGILKAIKESPKPKN